jgi:transcriptional regulator with XRE-family HTH domain
MLTKSHILTLRRTTPDRNRLGKAIELAGVTQNEVAHGVRGPNSYISDLVNGRYRTITLANAYRFSEYFQCRIEDLFPKESQMGGPHD